MDNPQMWQAVAAVIGAYAALLAGMYAVVTRPLVARMDDINRRLDAIERRLENIESLLLKHEGRITRVEERTSPFRSN